MKPSAITLGLLLSGATTLPALAAPFAYIPTYYGNVVVMDTATNQKVATIPAQSVPYGVAVNPTGTRVYVTNNNSGTVSVINAQSNSVITHIPVGNAPAEVVVKPDGTRVYVANQSSGTISVINTATNAVIATVSLGGQPWGLAVNPTGTRVYVGRYDIDQVWVLDTATNAFVGTPITVGDGPLGLEVNPAGTRLYVVNQNSNNVTVINTANNTIVATVPVGSYPLDLAIKPDGSQVYVGNRNNNTISVIDAATNAVVGLIPTGTTPYGVDVNPTGGRLYVANYNSHNLSILNTANNTLITNLSLQPETYPHALGRFIGPAPAPATTTRLSLSSSGSQGSYWYDSTQGTVSADGRYLAFVSEAYNLVGGDTNGAADVFVRDRITKQTRRVSVGPAGVQANGPSFDPVISADGAKIAFASDATNLVSGDTNGATDVFVRDLATATTTRVSVNSAATPVQGNKDSYEPALNADGTKVAFTSEATNLVTGDTNNLADVFVRDRTANTTARVSIATGAAGAQAVGGASGQAYLSGSGQFVAFISRATNLVASDTNNAYDVFIRDRTANTTARVSIATGATGAQANKDSWQPALSSDARYVVFASDATNLATGDSNGVADIFLRDRTANTTSRVSLDVSGGQADGPSYNPVISNDGRYVAFDSLALLDPVDYNEARDIYLRDRTSATTTRLSVSTKTLEGNADSQRPAMSADGRYVLFESFASNLVNGDTNYGSDIFVRDRGVGTTPAYPLSPASTVQTVEK